MLVVSRKANESVVIGDDIRIVVVGLEPDHVKLGIEAPSDVPIRRDGRSGAARGRVGKAAARVDRPGGADGECPDHVEC